MEKILSINEHREKPLYVEYAGYEVVTDKQRITLMIEDESNCCERWGYFLSHDDPQEFIGATLLDVTLVDAALNVTKVTAETGGDRYMDEGAVMFVNLVTDRGVLQFVAYNAHNGYYSHTAIVRSTQLNHETAL